MDWHRKGGTMNEQIEILILEIKKYLEVLAKDKDTKVVDKVYLKNFIEEINNTLKYYK
jgi:hypothetical protein